MNRISTKRCNNCKYIRQTTTAINGDINSKTIIMGVFNTPLSSMGKSSRQKIVRGHSTLRNQLKGIVFFLCVLFLKGPLFLIGSWKTGTSRAARSSQDWGHETERIRGFLSVTFYFSVKLLSHVPISNTWIVFWPCDDCYSPSYCCYGPVTIVIPLVTVVMLLFSVFFTLFFA